MVYEYDRILDVSFAWQHVYRWILYDAQVFESAPKADGKSKLDWQNYWVETSRHLWTDEAKAFLDQLVEPVPGPFRDIAKHSIAAEIGKIAVENKATEVSRDHCIKGYIIATPKRDNKFLVKFLEKTKLIIRLINI